MAPSVPGASSSPVPAVSPTGAPRSFGITYSRRRMDHIQDDASSRLQTSPTVGHRPRAIRPTPVSASEGSWNSRGINALDKRDAVKPHASSSACAILCLQETKRASFDQFFIRLLAPRNLDCFAYSPSLGLVGNSGGLLMVWDVACFSGLSVQALPFGLHVKLVSRLSSITIHVVNVYGPCVEPARS
ncbi:hypothetical protein BRADI_5g10876v3 [Brachypodium distachyon]|uniref:Endonuclease/exonuclease/phosphatase domain-containing protein n=1 Tax=Brachypodium distachyon TaxID=15368 RepID=A0A2K2CGK1_BRADI|nr:hypothetical protein BRADI_5g10876v3 [Brachypodium distachyon]